MRANKQNHDLQRQLFSVSWGWHNLHSFLIFNFWKLNTKAVFTAYYHSLLAGVPVEDSAAKTWEFSMNGKKAACQAWIFFMQVLLNASIVSLFISELSIRTQPRGHTGGGGGWGESSQACKQALSGALGAGELKLSGPPQSRPLESLLRANATHLLLLFVAVTARLRRKIA